jgi:hypothetical protein
MIQDTSSTTGAGLTGLVYNSSGLKAYYRIGATGASTAITLATQTATGVWSSGGFAEIDSTNMKGAYRLDIPDAVAASSAMVTVYLYGATNMAPVALRIDCRPVPADLKKIVTQSVTAAAGVTFPATLASTTNITSATGIVPATGAITNAQAATIPTSGTINTTTPPTVTAIRTEMDTNSTKLVNLDATVSSRLATSGYTAPTTPPTVVQIRTEMDTNSTKLDATVSSRMATFTYTSPVGAAVNASQIGGVSATGVLVSTGVGSTSFLANAPTGSGGGGTGANPVTITIQTTLSVAIQGATVTAWKNGMIEGTLATNVSGVSVLSLDNGTYSIVVTANGYQGNTASLVVSGTTSQTYQLTAITITPSPSGGVTGYLYTTDTTGTVIQSGVVVSIQMTRTASGATGEAVSPIIKTVTSDSNGLAQFVGLTPLATYRFTTSRGTTFSTFVAGSSTFEITSAVV